MNISLDDRESFNRRQSWCQGLRPLNNERLINHHLYCQLTLI